MQLKIFFWDLKFSQKSFKTAKLPGFYDTPVVDIVWGYFRFPLVR
jgi:hypothetical protein